MALVTAVFWTQALGQLPEEKTAMLNEARQEMILRDLVGRDITDSRVLDAMRKVDRHRFVALEWQHKAYSDSPLPIEEGQTISQPYIVAFMSQALALKGTEKVLEIGTGSGYQAAVLGQLAKDVYTIEIVESLAKSAEQRLRELGIRNVTVRAGDGFAGWPEQAPFDAVMVTAAPEKIPAPLLEQLKIGGKLVIPVGPQSANQELLVVEKTGKDSYVKRSMFPVRFVPMTGKAQQPK